MSHGFLADSVDTSSVYYIVYNRYGVAVRSAKNMHSSIGHWTEYKIIWRVRCQVSGVCHHDCDVIYGPIFNKFGI